VSHVTLSTHSYVWHNSSGSKGSRGLIKSCHTYGTDTHESCHPYETLTHMSHVTHMRPTHLSHFTHIRVTHMSHVAQMTHSALRDPEAVEYLVKRMSLDDYSYV